MDTTSDAIGGRQIRALLKTHLSSESDFQAFFCDYFPSVYSSCSRNIDLTAQVTFYLEKIGPQGIYHALVKHIPSIADSARAKIPTPTGLEEDRDIVESLLNCYSLILGDGHGPAEYLLPGTSATARHLTPHKTAFMHWESEQFDEPAGELHRDRVARDNLVPQTRPNYAEHLIKGIPSQRIKMKNVKDRLLSKKPILNLAIRLLAPGVHISFSIMPIIEFCLAMNRKHSVIYTLMPRTGRRLKPNERESILKTYDPRDGIRNDELNYEQTKKFIEKIDSSRTKDYFIVRPCGGFVLDYEHGNIRSAIAKLETESIAVTDDHYRNIVKYGLFGSNTDGTMLDRVRDTDRQVLCANFEMQYVTTKLMLDWVRRGSNPNDDDLILNDRGLFRYGGTNRDPIPVTNNPGIIATGVERIYRIINSRRREKGAFWW